MHFNQVTEIANVRAQEIVGMRCRSAKRLNASRPPRAFDIRMKKVVRRRFNPSSYDISRRAIVRRVVFDGDVGIASCGGVSTMPSAKAASAIALRLRLSVRIVCEIAGVGAYSLSTASTATMLLAGGTSSALIQVIPDNPMVLTCQAVT